MPGILRFAPVAVELRLPVVDLAGARSISGLSDLKLLDLIDAGDLVSWDVSRAPNHRRELRILAESLSRWPAPGPAYNDASLVRLLYGEELPFISGVDFGRAWNCDTGHILNLIDDQVLATVPHTRYGRGRGNTPYITWASVVQFLKSRRLG